MVGLIIGILLYWGLLSEFYPKGPTVMGMQKTLQVELNAEIPIQYLLKQTHVQLSTMKAVS